MADTCAQRNARRGFTLIEILLVIGIVAVISTVVVLALKPQEIMRQARDARRIAEVATINKAIAFVNAQKGSQSLGDPTKIYVSLPDDVSPLCTSHTDLPLPPPGYAYSCVTTANFRKIDGMGWIPFDFRVTGGNPFSGLPVDPLNTALSGYYYIYVANTNYAVVALLESEKYLKRSAIQDDGTDDGRIEAGDTSIWSRASGLRGYWKFSENYAGTASQAIADSSVYDNNGILYGSAPGAFAAGKVGNAIVMNGGPSRYVQVNDNSTLYLASTTSILAWLKPADNLARPIFGDFVNNLGGIDAEVYLQAPVNTTMFLRSNDGTTDAQTIPSLNVGTPTNTWTHIAFLWSEGYVRGYQDGSIVGAPQAFGVIPTIQAHNFYLGTGYWGPSLNGLLDELRIYSRPLHPAEISATYRATR